MLRTYKSYLFLQGLGYREHGDTGWMRYRYGIYSRYLAARFHDTEV